MSTYLKELQARKKREEAWEALDDCKKCNACYIHVNSKVFVFIHSTDYGDLPERVRDFTSNRGVITACKKHCDQCYLDTDNEPIERQLANDRSRSIASKTNIMVNNFKIQQMEAEQKLREAQQFFE